MSAFLKLIIGFLALIPFKLRLCLGRILGFTFSLFPTKERKIAELQIQISAKHFKQTPKVGAVYAELGQTFVECLYLTQTLDSCRINWHAEQEINQIIKNKSVAIFLSAHTANWELLAAALAKKGLALNVIGKPAQKSYFQELLERLRFDFAVKTIWREQAGSSKQILKALNSSEVVAALIDQDTDVSSVFAPFFGRLAKVPLSVVEIALRREIPLYSVFIFRDAQQEYSIYFEKLAGNDSALTAIEQYNQRLEALICRYPNQWVWFHKRWRSTPQGGKLSSKDYIRFLQGELLHD